MFDIRDSRFTKWYVSINPNRMTAIVNCFGGDEGEREVKFRYEVCPICQGRGQYGKPNSDRHGLSREDFDQWDDEEISDYFTGAYDVRCEYCEGRAVVPVTDDKDVLADIAEYEADMAEMYAIYAAEQRMGA